MVRIRLSFRSLLPLLLLGACAIPNTIELLDAHDPPPEFGRPAWVRTSAGIGFKSRLSVIDVLPRAVNE